MLLLTTWVRVSRTSHQAQEGGLPTWLITGVQIQGGQKGYSKNVGLDRDCDTVKQFKLTQRILWQSPANLNKAEIRLFTAGGAKPGWEIVEGY